MADTVNSNVIVSNSQRYHIQITNESDGTGESAVVKIDKSTLTTRDGVEPKALDLLWIDFQVNGFNYIVLEWDHTTNDEISVLAGNGHRDYKISGGIRDPISAGATGDVVLTTDGPINGASYDIEMMFKLRSLT